MDTDTQTIRPSRSSPVVQLVVAVGGVFLAAYGVWMFNQHGLMSFALPQRLVLMIVTQWLLVSVPGILMYLNRESLKDLGFSNVRIQRQVRIGVLLALGMSILFTVVPIVLGFGDMVGSSSYTRVWQFAYQFVYALVGVALAEELIFRGYIFHKLLSMKDSKWVAIVGSSALFGLFHIFGGDILQVVVTGLLGVLFCVFREKILGCTLLSLIVAHGLYDALIVFWVSVL